MPKKSLFKIRKIRKYSRKKSIKQIAEKKDRKPFFTVKTIRILKYAGLILITVIATIFVYYREQTGEWFKASVLEMPQAFNGTVMPIANVPNWTHWGGDNKTTLYASVSSTNLIDMPSYDLDKMTFPDNQLVWGNVAHDLIRNIKITYSVVYLGNYELDHIENSGSHLGVDIKIPVGTPLYNIANGKVVKAVTDESGFGNHIVIKHTSVPDIDNPGKLTTLYSCYAHMDKIDVINGQNLLKGEQIGTSGNSGTATTPHLHFQIDRDSAPWHPYWPFTWSESQEAGLSFFEAINAGLGKDKAQANTVNPMKYVAQYINFHAVASADDTVVIPDNTDNQPDDDTTNPDTPPDNTSETPDDIEIVETPTDNKIDSSLFTYELSGETVSLINNGITIKAIDSSNQIKKLSDNDVVEVKLSGVGSLSKNKFKKSDFKNNSVNIIVQSSEAGTSDIAIGKSSYRVTFIKKVNNIAAFKIEHDGHYQRNTVEIIKIVAIDANGNPTPAANFAGTVRVTLKEGSGKVTPDRITANDFVNGVAKVRLTVSNKRRVIIRAQEGALVGESTALTAEDKKLFTDINQKHPNYEAIKYLKENDVIKGYPDGSFKPNNTVNRVEALKMLMLAFNIEAGVHGPLPFSDTTNDAWYANALATAVNKKIVIGYPDGTFRPANTVNRVEYLKMLFVTNEIENNKKITANPYNDVPKDTWFTEYAYLTNKMNLLDVENNKLYPANGMTRAEVTETIYRMRIIQIDNLVSYSK